MRCTPDVRDGVRSRDILHTDVTIDITLIFCSLPRLSSTVVSCPLTEDAQTD